MAQRNSKARRAQSAPAHRPLDHPGVVTDREPHYPGLFALLIITLGSFVAFTNALNNEFTRDDVPIIVQNPMVHSWSRVPELLVSDYWASAERITDKLYRPALMISYLANYSIGGDDPFSYHLVNLFLHILVAFAVYQLARRLRLGWKPAVLAAALFAVHPIHTEVVDPVTGRADLLATLAVLLALNWYIDLTRRRDFHRPTALAAWGIFAAGLFSKESTIVLPGLLVLYECYAWHGVRQFRYLLTRKALLMLGFLVVAVLYLAVRWSVMGELYRAGGSIAFVDNPIAAAPWAHRVLTACAVAGKYLLLFVWPLYLSHDYSYHAIRVATSLWDPRVLVSLAVWLGLCVMAARSYLRGARFIFFAVGYLLITFLPVSNLIVPIGTIMGERLFYMPSVGLCLLAGGAWQWLFDKSRFRVSRVAAKVSYALAVTVLVLLTARTVVRNHDWRSFLSIWEAAVRVVPESAKVHYVFAVVALTEGRFTESLASFDRSLEIYPEFPDEDVAVAKRYGALLLKLERPDEAIPYLEKAVQGWPRWADAQLNLGMAYASQGSWEKAERHFRKAIALDIKKLRAHKGLMVSLRKQGRHEEVIEAAGAALSVKHDFMAARVNKAASLRALGRNEEAQKELASIAKSQAPAGLDENEGSRGE